MNGLVKRRYEMLTRVRDFGVKHSQVKTIPELTTQVELPDGANDQRLLSVTRQFIEAIGPYAEQFAAHGITTDQLRQHVEDLESTLTEHELRRTEQKQAREQIDGSMTRALEALETLDVAVANHLASDPEQLAAWKRSRTLPRTKRREAADAEAIAAPPAPEAAAVPAAPDAAPSPPVVPAERAA